MGLLLFQAIATSALNAGFAIMVGVLAAGVWLGNTGKSSFDNLAQRLSWTMSAGLWLCGSATVFSLWQAVATMGDVPLLDVDFTLWKMFWKTHYGHAGLVNLALLAILWVMHRAVHSHCNDKFYVSIVGALLLFYATARVTIGHAFEFGLFSLPVLVEWVHLVLMAVWSGSVMVAGFGVLPMLLASRTIARIGDPTINTMNEQYLAALSKWATVALIGILLTGFYNAYRVLNQPTDLVAGEYGWILSTKLCLVLLAMGLGAWNRFFGFPAVCAAGDGTAEDYAASDQSTTWVASMKTVITILRVESMILLAVLVAAAFLTSSTPPAAP